MHLTALNLNIQRLSMIEVTKKEKAAE